MMGFLTELSQVQVQVLVDIVKWLFHYLFLTYLSGTLGAAFSGRLTGWLSQPAIMAFGVCLLIFGSGLILTLVLSLWLYWFSGRNVSSSL